MPTTRRPAPRSWSKHRTRSRRTGAFPGAPSRTRIRTTQPPIRSSLWSFGTTSRTHIRSTPAAPARTRQINRDGLRHYSFPKSRLRRIDQLEPIQLTLDAIDPNPYHSRNFTVAENRDYIAAIRDRGRPDPPPIVRDCGDRFELLNGHKRVWASYVAGLESIPCDVHYERELYAARTWLGTICRLLQAPAPSGTPADRVPSRWTAGCVHPTGVHRRWRDRPRN